MYNILQKRGMSYKKTEVHRTANVIFLRFQIAQDYWSEVRFILIKTHKREALNCKKEKKNSCKWGNPVN